MQWIRPWSTFPPPAAAVQLAAFFRGGENLMQHQEPPATKNIAFYFFIPIQSIIFVVITIKDITL